MTLETVLDWLYRAKFAVEDNEPLSLKQYLTETKEAIDADKRMKEVERVVMNLSSEERDRREHILEEEKGDGVGEVIF